MIPNLEACLDHLPMQ